MSKFNFNEVLKRVELTKTVVPKLLANQAQNYFVKSFKVQGFDGVKWKEVNRRIEDTKEWKYPKKKGLARRKKPILIETGELRRRVNNSVVLASWNMIKLVVDLPYAKAQNEGNARITARPFMKQSPILNKQLVETIEKEFNKIW